MYLPIDYNCFVNQLYHKVQIICKKKVTCKKKQGDFNFALQSRGSDFSQYRARISPTSSGLVSPDNWNVWLIHTTIVGAFNLDITTSLYPLQRSCRGVYWFHHVHPSVRPSVDKSYVIR
jgi:hypothetical protein